MKLEMPADSDDHLVRYLLGELPDDETERLDERSIVDEEFSQRLRMLEDELVDRYVRGEPLHASLERFDRLHRRSPHLLDKVRFARALHEHALAAGAAPGPARVSPAPMRPWWWGLAAAAVLLLAAGGYLATRNLQLRERVTQLEAHRGALEQQIVRLEDESSRRAQSPPPRLSPVAAAFLLPAPRRGAAGDTTISVPQGTAEVILRLQVETDEYAVFWATVRDLSANRAVWRSGDLGAATLGNDQLVSVTVPAGVLEAGRYAVELTGVPRSGPPEIVAHYPLRVVLE